MNIIELYELFKQYPSVQTDTRKLKKDDLFFALRGPNFNANAFAETALNNGAAYAIIDDADYNTHAKMILVDDVLTALQQLAAYHRNQFDIPFLAITGSNGKTTTKELIHAVLSTSYKTYTTVGNLNNHIGVPLTLLSIQPDAEMAVIEMGANHVGEIASYCVYTRPDYGLVTNVGKAHLEGFGGYEGVKRGKGELYDFLRENNGTAFVMWDYEYLQEMSQGIKTIIPYGTTSPSSDLSPADDRLPAGNSSLPGSDLSPAGETPTSRSSDLSPAGGSGAEGAEGGSRAQRANNASLIQSEPFLKLSINNTTISTQLVGSYNLPNVLAAFTIGRHFNIPEEKIKQALENYTPSNSRSQLIEKDENKIILDAYNANPSSMRAAIENFAKIPAENKVLMLGAMAELGAESLQEHKDIIELIKNYNWAGVVLIGGDFLKVSSPFQTFNNSVEAAQWFRDQKFTGAYFLIKGSRSMQMEKVIQ